MIAMTKGELARKLQESEAENEKLRKMLQRHEWSADWRVDYDDTASSCPECCGINPDDYHAEDGRTDGQPIGHLKGCAYQALLTMHTEREETDVPDINNVVALRCPECWATVDKSEGQQ